MKLTPEKQKNLAIVGVVFAAILYGLWFFLVQGQQTKQQRDERELKCMKGHIDMCRKMISDELTNRQRAKVFQAYIAKNEELMPKGNAETWLTKTMSDLAAQYKIPTPSNTTLQSLADLSEFKFKKQPYKVVAFRCEFKTELAMLGKFLADLENKIPLMEVHEIEIKAGSEIQPYVHTVTLLVTMVVRA